MDDSNNLHIAGAYDNLDKKELAKLQRKVAWYVIITNYTCLKKSKSINQTYEYCVVNC